MNKKFVRKLSKKLHNMLGQPVLVLYAGHSPAVGFVSSPYLEINQAGGSIAIPTRGHIVYDKIGQRPLKQAGGIPLGYMSLRLKSLEERIFFGRDIELACMAHQAEISMESIGKLVDVVTIGTSQLDRRTDKPHLFEIVEASHAKKRATMRRQVMLMRALHLASAILERRHAK